MTLNEATLNSLKTVSGILQKGHHAHRSLKLIYILITLFGVIAAIAIVELFFWNRQVSQRDFSWDIIGKCECHCLET